MSLNKARVLLFGDATVDPVSSLRQLNKDAKHFASIGLYLRLCASALNTALKISTLPSKKHYPSFESIIELSEWLSRSPTPQIAVSAVLLCVAQIGILVRECEIDPSLLIPSEIAPIYAIGLCNGMIGAAALACCKSTADLLNIGPRLVQLNLRLLLVLMDRSDSIEESEMTWTMITPRLNGADHEPLIADFVATEGSIPATHLPYISARAEIASTISGPPSTLSKYFSSCEKLKEATKLEVPINTACHAEHIQYQDLNSILGYDEQLNSLLVRKNVNFVSVHTGEIIEVTNLAALLLQGIDEVLNRTFRWDLVLRKLDSHLRSSFDHVTIYAIGPDRVSTSVKNSLMASGCEATIVDLASQRVQKTLSHYDDVAIVGMSGRLPGGGNDLTQIWQLLKQGRDTHSKVPADRFDLNDHYDPSGERKNTTTVPFGCFIDRPGDFDTKLFNMSPREARQTDPMQRLALLTTYEALEMAGYSPNSLPSFYSERIGTFFGQTLDDYRESNASQDIDIYFVPGGIRAFGPGRLNFHFKWEGPSMSVDTACSSSAMAIQLAFQSLRNGECDLAVAGGMNVITSSDMYAGLSRGGFLSKTGQSKTFGEDADGYCRGEGVGTVVLKRLQDAIADHDDIVAVIKSVSTNHSAFAKSITHPHAGAQIKLMRKVLRDADVDPNQVDYVEMHGTGTAAGDPVELASVAEVFGEGRTPQNPVHVGSIKANIGHGEAAAGINSLIKVLLMLRNNAIPANIGVGNKISARFTDINLDTVSITTTTHNFPRQESRPRRVVLNSFNAAGGNTAMVIEDAPKLKQTTLDPRSHHIIAISGHTRYAFLENRRKLLEFLLKHQQICLADVAYTTTARRIQHSMRMSVIAQSIVQAIEVLARSVDSNDIPAPRSNGQKVIFTFTGQGSHHLNQARSLLLTSPLFKSRLLLYDSLCQNAGFPSCIELLQKGSIGGASQAQVHLSILAIQMALVASLEAWGIKPDAVIGHSIGEYAALFAAKVLSAADALYLVGNRGLMIDKLCEPGTHAMLAVSSNRDKLDQIVSRAELNECTVACHNGPSSFVIGGPRLEILKLMEELESLKISNKLVGVEYGYHSSQMEHVSHRIDELCIGVNFKEPQIPVASTLLGKVVHTTGVFNGAYLASQTRKPVLFREALEDLSTLLAIQGQSIWFEIGTQPVCRPMITSTLPIRVDSVLYTLCRTENPWESLSKAVAAAFNIGIDVNWARFHEDFHHALSVVDLPKYSFDLSNYWIPYHSGWKLKRGKETSTSLIKTKPTVHLHLAPFHYLASESFGKKDTNVHFVCDLKDEKLFSMIQGHLVDSVGLCPSSVYAHLAYNAAAYVFDKIPVRFPAPFVTDLANMEITSPLTVSTESQISLLSITAAWNSSSPQQVIVTFTTESTVGNMVHCRCVVTAGKSSTWIEGWRDLEYLIQGRVRLLADPSQSSVHTLHRNMIYHLFASSIVKYSSDYQICESIGIDYDQNECLAKLKIPHENINRNGSPGPFCLDVIMHTAGFVLNSSPVKPHNTVFIASGWTSLRLAESLCAGQTYTCHTRMAVGEKPGLYIGNVSILSGDHIIGICRGLRFHQLKRTSLHKLLGIKQSMPQSKPDSKPAPLTGKPSQTQSSRNAIPQSRPQHRVNAKSTTLMTDIDAILEDIALETGISVHDLHNDVQLSVIGIDSILSIALLGRFEARTGSTLPANIFSVCASIYELKEYLKKQPSRNNTAVTIAAASQKQWPLQTTVTTQPLIDELQKLSRSQILCNVIANEVGITAEEVKSTESFGEMGIDSLLMISIINEFKAQTGEDLGAKFFNDNPLVQNALDTMDAFRATTTESSDTTPTLSSNLSDEDKDTTPELTEAENGSSDPAFVVPGRLKIVSMLIQGDRNNADPALFFLPDGSGSLFSYIHLPELRTNLRVYAFDSPFHKNPEKFNTTFDAIATAYAQEIQRIQPHGPYIIAGWSLGGVHAYEVTRQLLANDEEVQHLIMLDSPCPGTLPPLPNASLDLLEKAGVFEALKKEQSRVAEHTRTHFVQITQAFNQWKDQPLRKSEQERLSNVSIIWAQRGVLEDDEEARNAWVPGMEKMDADMLKAKEWLTGKRTDFSDGGWRRLVGKDIKISIVSGNHFSMMFPPKVTEVADILREILS